MLRLFSSKIFREDLKDNVLPMWAFENFSDVEELINKTNTYKFCIPVSIGDFAEIKIPACFSNNVEEIKRFVEQQIKFNHVKAFIISDFQITDLDKICFSGVISTNSEKGYGNYFNKSTIISMTLKNPILTYANEGISPRDLPEDIQLIYDHVSNPMCAIPKIGIKKEYFDIEKYKSIIYQAYLTASKIHNIALEYDGEEYSEYALFFVDQSHKIWLYEIVGEESFINRAKCDKGMIREELDFIINNKSSELKLMRKKQNN